MKKKVNTLLLIVAAALVLFGALTAWAQNSALQNQTAQSERQSTPQNGKTGTNCMGISERMDRSQMMSRCQSMHDKMQKGIKMME